MKIDSFQKLFIHSLKDLYSAETQIIEALPEMIEAASNPELKRSFEQHLEETRNHVERLETVFENLEFSPTGYRCQAMEGLIEEAQDVIQDGEAGTEVLDAGLIAAAQKVEHYEIASYGTVVHFARMLGQDSIAQILSETLDEEKKTDAMLNDLAMSMINPQAVEESGGGEARPS